jgi:hypothetical protein
MLVFLHQNAGQNRDIKEATGSFENVSQFKYLGRSMTSKFDSGGNLEQTEF